MNTGRLRAAYRAAVYCVPTPDGELVLRHGVQSAELDRALAALGVHRRWAIVTPCNPASHPLAPCANTRRLREFLAELDARHINWHASVNHDPRGMWPDEPGALLCDAPLRGVRELAMRYGQNAFLTAALGRPPYFGWTSPAGTTGL